MKHLESKIQQECVRWFRLQYPNLLIYAIPNGGKRGIITASIMKAEGVIAGAADVHIPIARGKYHSLYIEMKSQTGKQQPSQVEFQKKVESFGNAYMVCRSFDEFQATVTGYLSEQIVVGCVNAPNFMQ